VVSSLFILERFQWFVIPGEIIEGTVRPGMTAQLFSGSAPVFAERIHGVEFVDHIAERTARVALTFRYASAEQRAKWQNVGISGQVLTISDTA
jgi:hypothetical protein